MSVLNLYNDFDPFNLYVNGIEALNGCRNETKFIRELFRGEYDMRNFLENIHISTINNKEFLGVSNFLKD